MAEARFTTLLFAQSNPKGPGQNDVPALLRRVANSIEEYGDIEVRDIILHSERTEDGEDWPSLTVYYLDPTVAASYVDSSSVAPREE